MIELKVICDCGQKYKFDVEPVNGQMPFTVNCPVCSADGTNKANILLQQRALAPTPATVISYTPPPAPVIAPAPPPVPVIAAPVPIIAPVSAPVIAPVPAQASVAAVAPPPIGGPKLRINIPAQTTTPEGAPPPISAPGAIAPPPLSGRPLGRPLAPASTGEPAKKGNFWMGMLGAFLGALLGAVLCYVVFKLTGVRFRLLVVGLSSLATGYLAGAGAHLLGKGEGSKELGGIAAIFALAAIVTAQYFIALSWWHEETTSIGDSAYADSVKEAKEAVRMVPTGSDSEIRVYLVKQAVEDGDDVTSNSISDDQVAEFRTNELPVFQSLASGQLTRDQYNAKNGITAAQEKMDESSDTGGVMVFFLLLFLRKTTIVAMCAGAGLAYRISANA